jgi:protein-disulfide isomerase
VAGVTGIDARYAVMLDEVRADVKLAHGLGVTGTPTCFVNGIKLLGLPASLFRQALLFEARIGPRTE